MNFTEARAQFPALREKSFLDAACVSLTPLVATEAIQQFLEVALHCPSRSSTLHHIAIDEMRSNARTEAAGLINADESEIALVESTSHGLAIAAEALSLERGDRILTSDLEFLEVAVPWCQKQQRMGLEIDVVPNNRGAIHIEDVAERITPRTKAVVISSVQWSNGFRLDLDSLSALCRDRRISLVIDAVQQLGAFPIDVRKTPIDILACGGHKWLNAPFGVGLLYINRNAFPALLQPLTGYLNIERPEGGWGNYFQTPEITPVRDYKYISDARRFEIGGTSNYPGAIGLAASLHMINQLGSAKIASFLCELTTYLLTELIHLGVEIVTPVELQTRSGIITFSLGSRDRNLALMEYLLEHKVLISVRYTSGVGGVRVSSHFFNTKDDLDRVIEHTRNFLRS